MVSQGLSWCRLVRAVDVRALDLLGLFDLDQAEIVCGLKVEQVSQNCPSHLDARDATSKSLASACVRTGVICDGSLIVCLYVARSRPSC